MTGFIKAVAAFNQEMEELARPETNPSHERDTHFQHRDRTGGKPAAFPF
jgi:hypothetical protein